MDQNEMKRSVAIAAVDYVRDDSVLGVGTGSTVNAFLDALLSKGGMSSMLNTVWLILCALGFGVSDRPRAVSWRSVFANRECRMRKCREAHSFSYINRRPEATMTVREGWRPTARFRWRRVGSERELEQLFIHRHGARVWWTLPVVDTHASEYEEDEDRTRSIRPGKTEAE